MVLDNPFMLYRCLELMNINEIRSVLKIDDTVAGIEEVREHMDLGWHDTVIT